LWTELLLGAALALFLGFLTLGFVLNAAGAYHSHSGRVGQGIAAVICLALLVPCVRWTISVEHRLRRHHPIVRHFEARHDNVQRPRARVLVRGRRRYGPVGLTVGTLLFGALTIGFAVGAVVEHAHASRSAYVQHHGTFVVGTVASVVNTEHCSRGGCHYTAAVAVLLGRRVAGTGSTTVHYPGFSSLVTGEPVQVLVDPKQPAYAEIPGARFTSAANWIVLVILAVIEAGLAYLSARALVHVLAHRREHRAASSA
jgi:hypothetical protein